MESNQEQPAFLAFERLFRERGLPQAIRSDNGVPFARESRLFSLPYAKSRGTRPAIEIGAFELRERRPKPNKTVRSHLSKGRKLKIGRP